MNIFTGDCNKNNPERKEKLVTLAVYSLGGLFFLLLWATGTLGEYNDSHQYIAMHIHREPLYPFILWVFRSIAGENYLEVVRFLQNVLAAFACIYFTDCIRKEFSLKGGITLLVLLIQIVPHSIIPLLSVSGLVIPNGIISEALGMPLFLLFAAQCLKFLLHGGVKNTVSALVLSVLLTLTRGQMMTMILVWALCAGVRCVIEKKWKRILLVLVSLLLAFGTRGILVKSYNLCFNGRFIDNTYGPVNFLSNMLYAADREDGEAIKDEEAMEFYYMMYDLVEENQANYKYAGDSAEEKIAHLETWHDPIKFDMIEQPMRDYHDSIGLTDYISENLETDRVAGLIIKDLLPEVFWQWLMNYLLLSLYGLVRSVAIVHPLLNIYALAAYVAVVILMIWLFLKKKQHSPAAWFSAFALLCILANVYATSMVIMCLSRYMIYCLPLFYTAGLMLLVEAFRSMKRKFL